ncbi:hypothetical protein DD109_13840 [Clostridioides difficile]|nr:hypothetical protein CWR55_11370 [Clostridioides difficile]AYC94166.1 hypothetical protein DA418_11235 [Clostridioides difficile]EGT3823067.1 hypothetical protein [Clostridioides difficile]EGT3842409.1 hypothetical protein [Clostridioides difficile]EGT3872718.1 hypothetical protein [Clostridioides difficile]
MYKIKCIFIILIIKKSLSLFEKALFNLIKMSRLNYLNAVIIPLSCKFFMIVAAIGNPNNPAIPNS